MTLHGQRRAKESKRRTLDRVVSEALAHIPLQMLHFCAAHDVPVHPPREPRYFVTSKVLIAVDGLGKKPSRSVSAVPSCVEAI